ncbi:MAG: hypothetical protein JOZ62_12020, partial [Acidobacteriaceae bacterium]|nr:hypothetical protein [Acidobacteriaceae bacterium]
MRTFSLAATLLVSATMSLCDTGVIIPSGSNEPDSSILSIESLDVHVSIDNGHATVSLKEVFQNHKDTNL